MKGNELNTLASSNKDDCVDIQSVLIEHNNGDAFNDPLDSWQDLPA